MEGKQIKLPSQPWHTRSEGPWKRQVSLMHKKSYPKKGSWGLEFGAFMRHSPRLKTLAWWTWRRWLSDEVEEETLQMIEFSSSLVPILGSQAGVWRAISPPDVSIHTWEGSLDFSPLSCHQGFLLGPQAARNRPHYRVHTGLTTWPPPGCQGVEAAEGGQPEPLRPASCLSAHLLEGDWPSVFTSCPSWSIESARGLFADQRGCLLCPGSRGSVVCVALYFQSLAIAWQTHHSATQPCWDHSLRTSFIQSASRVPGLLNAYGRGMSLMTLLLDFQLTALNCSRRHFQPWRVSKVNRLGSQALGVSLLKSLIGLLV